MYAMWVVRIISEEIWVTVAGSIGAAAANTQMLANRLEVQRSAVLSPKRSLNNLLLLFCCHQEHNESVPLFK